jgi:hypothetical protein
MDQGSDPTGGWAKATEAAADALKDTMQAGRDLASFLSGPAGELVGMGYDHLKVVRFERGVRLVERLRHFLAERGLEKFTRKITLNMELPILENATLEEDDELQDLWAMLLVNGGDADSGIEMRRAFVSVLAEMTALDVRNLAAIEQASPVDLREGSITVWTGKLPDEAVPVSRRDVSVYSKKPSVEVLTSLSNLERLGCIYSGDQAGGLRAISPVQAVGLTPFGRAFVLACTHSPVNGSNA